MIGIIRVTGYSNYIRDGYISEYLILDLSGSVFKFGKEKVLEIISKTCQNYGWYEIAGKHSYVEVSDFEVILYEIDDLENPEELSIEDIEILKEANNGDFAEGLYEELGDKLDTYTNTYAEKLVEDLLKDTLDISETLDLLVHAKTDKEILEVAKLIKNRLE